MTGLFITFNLDNQSNSFDCWINFYWTQYSFFNNFYAIAENTAVWKPIFNREVYSYAITFFRHLLSLLAWPSWDSNPQAS